MKIVRGNARFDALGPGIFGKACEPTQICAQPEE